MLRYKTELHLV